jgi:hypothetical protein
MTTSYELLEPESIFWPQPMDEGAPLECVLEGSEPGQYSELLLVRTVTCPKDRGVRSDQSGAVEAEDRGALPLHLPRDGDAQDGTDCQEDQGRANLGRGARRTRGRVAPGAGRRGRPRPVLNRVHTPADRGAGAARSAPAAVGHTWDALRARRTHASAGTGPSSYSCKERT